MDDTTRRTARTRAAIAFALAGLLLVLNVVLGFAWREARRDRIDERRTSIERRIEDRWQQGDDPGVQGPWGAPDGMGPGGMGPDGAGPATGGRGDSTDRDSTDRDTDQGGDTSTQGTAT